MRTITRSIRIHPAPSALASFFTRKPDQALAPGTVSLLEAVYEYCLAEELRMRVCKNVQTLNLNFMDYRAVFQELNETLKKVKGMDIKQSRLVPWPSDEPISDLLPSSVAEFYRQHNGAFVNWEYTAMELSASSRVKILPLYEVNTDWKDIMWFYHTPAKSMLRKFSILDFFINEACVGFYIDGIMPQTLHFYDFEDTPINMHLDFDGYFRMMRAARGFMYWQVTVLSFLDNRKYPEMLSFKENMPKIFPDFSFDAFRELYEEVRLDT